MTAAQADERLMASMIAGRLLTGAEDSPERECMVVAVVVGADGSGSMRRLPKLTTVDHMIVRSSCGDAVTRIKSAKNEMSRPRAVVVDKTVGAEAVHLVAGEGEVPLPVMVRAYVAESARPSTA